MMKRCTKCDLLKNEENFNCYFRFEKKYVRGYCRLCERTIKKEYKEKIKNLLTSSDNVYGGSFDDYCELPNHYSNEEQRLAVFRIMKLLNYTFNKSTGVWFKLPFKLPDGTFTNLKSDGRKGLKKTVSIIHTNKISELYAMQDDNKTIKEMAIHFNTHKATIEKYLHQRKKKNESKN